MGGRIVLRPEGQMELSLPQVVGFGPIPELRQLQSEGRPRLVLEEDDPVGPVRRPLFPEGREAQGLLVKGQAPLHIKDVEVEMVEGQHGFSSLAMVYR